MLLASRYGPRRRRRGPGVEWAVRVARVGGPTWASAISLADGACQCAMQPSFRGAPPPVLLPSVALAATVHSSGSWGARSTRYWHLRWWGGVPPFPAVGLAQLGLPGDASPGPRCPWGGGWAHGRMGRGVSVVPACPRGRGAEPSVFDRRVAPSRPAVGRGRLCLAASMVPDAGAGLAGRA